MFIKDIIRFNNFIEFYVKKEIIRARFCNMGCYEKEIYKYYIYSKRIMSVRMCDMIWEYLNAIDDEEMLICISNLDKEKSRYL